PYFAGFRALTTHEIDKPLLNLFRMFGLMGGERIAAQSSGALSLETLLESSARSNPDINVMATRKGNNVSVLAWNYDDEATEAPPANINLTIDDLPQAARRVLCENFRVGPDLSDSYTVWKAMGSPQQPSPAEYAKVKAAGQLHLLGSPQWLRSENGAVKLKFALPRQGVSLVYLRW
ncbi:MAG TPA: beta-xylosidase, partial [Terriglobia bacterium]|nr:beta-xylosidase [Terriglobia bacterium]